MTVTEIPLPQSQPIVSVTLTGEDVDNILTWYNSYWRDLPLAHPLRKLGNALEALGRE